ncbi:DUF4115 domain-containing protein [bacterium]|nr:DUF4115 domain-containing protein [bacterium]
MNENTNINEIETSAPVELTAGEMLRNARTTGRRKREIPTISKQLCIREEFLQALEDGDYAAIPEQVYILGFARNYAMELGLDPDEVVAKIKREMGIVGDGLSDDSADVSARASGGAIPGAGVAKRAMAFVRRKWKWVLIAVAGLVILTVLALGMFVKRGEPVPDVQSDVVEVVTTQTVSEPKFTKTVRERFGTENRNSSRIILQAVHESWVKIEDGRGNTVFSRVLVPGDVYYVPNGNGYRATFGNAGGIDIWVDGASVDKVGAPHTRKTGIEMDADALLKNTGGAKKSDEEQKDDSDTVADAE